MKKRLLIGLMAFVYLVFCCAGIGFAFAENPQETAHFVHVDGHSDEYHGTLPGKLAIKAFFAKTPVKTNLPTFSFIHGSTDLFVPGNQFNKLSGLNNYEVPVKGAHYLFHCTLLI